MEKQSKKSNLKFPSELRLDLISKDWVVIATGRGKKPEVFKKEKKEEVKISPKICPFCNIETQELPLLIFSHGKKISYKGKIPGNWTTIDIPNKFPAFLPHSKFEKKIEGNLYQTMNAVGFCELVVTRDHDKSLALLSIKDIKEVIDTYQERYLDLMKKKFVNYIAIFHNHGLRAGASQPHPHSQIITTPLIDVDLNRALFNSENYYKKDKKCIYCQMNEWEKRAKERVIFENKDFLAICPFASKAAFEVIISPKSHLPYFEKITEKEKLGLSEAFKAALNKLYTGLGDPSYNFYLHTAPCDGKKYPYYHWHWTILPKTAAWAGFEMGAQMEISTIEPEKAAEYLRKLGN
ncbi:MAG: galactose-1-phosphate uridylyltransferase [Candidatus Nealsonbacteria bacterium CG02_land_8_20_14_3_00_40_11]|uniref:Galactose-1-phosphate uridylyltransferase n=1 Tax=Candidatus Nealsonbacteria bacterium CG02_land_8_20_14_3_00_40_11 TaxID=1974700 RepID=A0A2M7D718_9BACT|nr:MAG: galactose-1-phosphate uridylyltransferase [Candidatus Nealsonbacteria bacterium CG02_land_8_20_14_3_00_40_11]